MPTRPRVVATDLDGTVVRRDGSISDRTVAALRGVQESGATVVFVTGRPVRWMAPVAERTGHAGLAICGNGAVVYDLRSERMVSTRTLDGAVAADMVERIAGVVDGALFATESVHGFSRERRYPVYQDAVPHRVVETRAEVVDGPLLKLLVRHGSATSDELLARALPVVGGDAEATFSESGRGLLEISGPGVSKATTLAALCAEAGVTADEVVAFGDMPNDAAMLGWAGTAYAMADGHPSLLRTVARTAPPCAADGVAAVLEELFAL